MGDFIRAGLAMALGKHRLMRSSARATLQTGPDLQGRRCSFSPGPLPSSAQVISWLLRRQLTQTPLFVGAWQSDGRCTRSWPLTGWDFSDLNSVIAHVIWHSGSQTSELLEGRIKSQINEGWIKCTLDWSVHVAFEIALLAAQNALFLSTLGCSSCNLQTCCLTRRSACLPPGFPLGPF